MKYFKLLIIIMLLIFTNKAFGQNGMSALDSIDFNDTTTVYSNFMWQTIADYISSEQNKTADPNSQSYNMIIAADNVLSRSCTSYFMYKSVYEYLINGFSGIGANRVVDYLIQLPYLNYLDPDDIQRDEIMSVAAQYTRIKVGMQAPEIQSKTINNQEITLNKLKNKNTLIVFWSYSCPHCREMLKEIGKIAPKTNDMAIVTVCVSGDLRKVKRLLKKAHIENAYNICDGKGWDSPIVEDYAVDMTPSLFLLDENKLIIAKPFDIEEVINLVEI